MCTERKATGLFVLTRFLCDNGYKELIIPYGPLAEASCYEGLINSYGPRHHAIKD